MEKKFKLTFEVHNFFFVKLKIIVKSFYPFQNYFITSEETRSLHHFAEPAYRQAEKSQHTI